MALRPTRRIPVVSGLVAAAALVTGLAVAAQPAAATSTSVVISEVYGGGGNSGAPFKNDFIELQNVSSGPIALDGYSVQYTSSAGTSYAATPLTGTVAPGAYYLVAEAAGTGSAAPLPTPDATGTIAMSSSAGKVALVQGTGALTCGLSCATAAGVVDFVGYGTANNYEGAGPAPGPSNTTSDQRDAAGTDTDNNAADFTAVAPTPKAAPAGGTTCTPPTASATIDQIQGNGFLSPDTGQTVTGVRGIVTATESTGFWIQQVTGVDSDPATSEGVFVYSGSQAKPAVGASVAVDATVNEYDPQAAHASTSNLTITELAATAICTIAAGQPLPAPVVLGPDTVPDTYAFDNGGNSIEGLTIDPSRSALDFYESVEGMRVEVDDAQVVGPSDQYAEQYVTTKPDEDRTYRGGAELLGENQAPPGRLEVVALNGTNPGVDVGDEFAGATIGPLDYSQFGGYTLEASTLGAVVHNHLAPVAAHPGTDDQLSVATYNVENLSKKDPVTKFEALAAGVVNNLASPDVVALEEIQDNDGPTDDGVVMATLTLHRLIAKIRAAGGPTYKYREIDPVNDQDGGQPGGNIRVAFLYNPVRVSFVRSGSAKVDRSTTGTQVTDNNGTPGLTLSPGRIAPTDPAWDSSRKPLVGQFRFNGKDVFVIANHFDSKLGDQNADGRFQYPDRSSEMQRLQQATLVHDFVGQLLAVDAQARVLVVGDLNDYQFSPALATLKTGTPDGTGTPILTDLITTLPFDQQYTYVYDGISQVLDHILATPAVTAAPFDYQVVHVNSEFHDQVSDHDPQVVDITP